MSWFVVDFANLVKSRLTMAEEADPITLGSQRQMD
jgi:hypothetical protein